MNPHELLTTAEVARVCHVSKRTVQRWISRKAISVIRLGDQIVRVRASEVERFLRAGETAESAR